MLNCTIYTDASLKEGRVGVAYYCRSDGGCLKGKLRVPPEYELNIQEAEAFAVLCALREVNSQWPWVERFYIVVDNKTVQQQINRMAGRGGKVSFFGNSKGDWYDKIFAAIKKHLGQRPYEGRHVRAHTGRSDVRSWVNNFVDVASKEAREL